MQLMQELLQDTQNGQQRRGRGRPNSQNQQNGQHYRGNGNNSSQPFSRNLPNESISRGPFGNAPTSNSQNFAFPPPPPPSSSQQFYPNQNKDWHGENNNHFSQGNQRQRQNKYNQSGQNYGNPNFEYEQNLDQGGYSQYGNHRGNNNPRNNGRHQGRFANNYNQGQDQGDFDMNYEQDTGKYAQRGRNNNRRQSWNNNQGMGQMNNQQNYYQEQTYQPHNTRGRGRGRPAQPQRVPNNGHNNNQYEMQVEMGAPRNRGRGRQRGRGRGRGRQNYGQKFQMDNNYEQNRNYRGKRGRGNNRQNNENQYERGGKSRRGKHQITNENDVRMTEQEKNERLEKFGNMKKNYERMPERKKVEDKNFIKDSQSESNQINSEEEYQSNNYQSGSAIKQSEEYDDEDSKVPLVMKNDMQEDFEPSKATDEKCTKAQFMDRVATFKQNNPGQITLDRKLVLDTTRSFAIFQIDKKTNQPRLEYTLKRFKRSAERDQQNDDRKNEETMRRSLNGLIKVMHHINSNIIDSDRMSSKQLIFPCPRKGIQFIQIYDFLWDRMRQMIKDITRLSDKQRFNKHVIDMCEQIARFFIIAINEGRKSYETKSDFDAQMNKESLTKILTPLMDMYISSRVNLKKLINQMRSQNQDVTPEQVMERMQREGIYISENQPEMTSYAMLFSKDPRKYLYQHIFVGFQLTDYNPLYLSHEIELILDIQNALRTKNFQRYFLILQSGEIDYVLGCLMVHNIEAIRRQIAQSTITSFRHLNREGNWVKGIESQQLKMMLHFQDQEEYQTFLYAIGAYQNKDGYVCFGEKPMQGVYKSPYYEFEQEKTLRSNYNAQIPEQVSKIKNVEQYLSRRQLIGRTWVNEGYKESMVRAYMGFQQRQQQGDLQNQYSQKNGQKKDKKVDDCAQSNKIRQNIMEPKKKEVINKNEQNTQKIPEGHIQPENKLDSIREGLKRKKLIKQFTKKLVDLMSPDEHRETEKRKKFTNVLNIILKYVHISYAQGLNSMSELMEKQISQQRNLIKLQQFAETRNKFYNDLEMGENLEDFVNEATNMKMSDLLETKNNEQEESVKECGMIANVMDKMQLVRKPSKYVVKIFINKKTQKNSLLIKVVRNVINLLAPGFDWCKKIQLYQYQGIEVKVAYCSLHKDKQNWKQFLGVNCAIFLKQGSDTCSLFDNAIADLIKIKEQIGDNSFVDIKLGVFNFLSCLSLGEFETPATIVDCLSTNFLTSSSIRISSQLRDRFAELLTMSWEKYRISPQITYVSSQEFFNILDTQAQEVVSVIKNIGYSDEKNVLRLFMSSFLKEVGVLNREYYKTFEKFQNYVDVIEKISKTGITKCNFNIVVEKQIELLQILGEKLQLRYIQQSESLEKVAKQYLQIIQTLPIQINISSHQFEKYVKSIVNNDNANMTVSFFNFLWRVLGECLGSNYILIPEGFHSSFNIQQIIQLIQEQRQEAHQKEIIKSRQVEIGKNMQVEIGKSREMEININKISSQQSQQKQIEKALNPLKAHLQSKINKGVKELGKRGRSSILDNQFKYDREQWILQAKKRIKMA